MKITITTVYENVNPINVSKWINGVLSPQINNDKEKIENFLAGKVVSAVDADPRSEATKTIYYKLENEDERPAD